MTINYYKILDEALIEFIKKVLVNIQTNGISPNQSCYITFYTNYPQVILSSKVKSQYPHQITIVLENEFENLQVFDSYFQVGLKFNGIFEEVKIPFKYVNSFFDPYENFQVRLKNIDLTNLDVTDKNNIADQEVKLGNKVIILDQFRNNKNK